MTPLAVAAAAAPVALIAGFVLRKIRTPTQGPHVFSAHAHQIYVINLSQSTAGGTDIQVKQVKTLHTIPRTLKVSLSDRTAACRITVSTQDAIRYCQGHPMGGDMSDAIIAGIRRRFKRCPFLLDKKSDGFTEEGFMITYTLEPLPSDQAKAALTMQSPPTGPA
ncbi:MAG: hypothetical protein WCO52_04540 [bacterium]